MFATSYELAHTLASPAYPGFRVENRFNVALGQWIKEYLISISKAKGGAPIMAGFLAVTFCLNLNRIPCPLFA